MDKRPLAPSAGGGRWIGSGRRAAIAGLVPRVAEKLEERGQELGPGIFT